VQQLLRNRSDTASQPIDSTWREGVRDQVAILAMLRWVHRDNTSAPARPTIVGVLGGSPWEALSPALRREKGIVTDNVKHIIITKHMPASTALIQPHRLRVAHLLKPVIHFLYIIQSRERM